MDDMRAALDDETRFMIDLPEYAWSRMAAMVDGCYSAKDLHDQTVKCALISGAYNLR